MMLRAHGLFSFSFIGQKVPFKLATFCEVLTITFMALFHMVHLFQPLLYLSKVPQLTSFFDNKSATWL